MNIIETKTITKQLFTDDRTKHIPVCWVGGSGLGKTTQAKKLAEELQLPLVYLTVRTDDALGINMIRDGALHHVPHHKLAKVFDTPTFIYIDELNRADRYARAQVMELLGERTIGGEPVHPDTVVVVTVNPESEAYEVTELDQALKTRVVPIPVTFDAELSLQYAKENRLHAMVSYLQSVPDTLNEELVWHITKPDTRILEYLALVVQVSPTASEIVSFVLQDNASHFIGGVINPSTIDVYDVTAPRFGVDLKPSTRKV